MVLQIIRKRIDDTAIGADGASPEMRVSGGYIQWRQDDGSPDWTNLIAVAALVGAAGADGIDGESPLMRTYFGTIQWSNDGGAVWNHLINLADITGEQGAAGISPIMRIYFGTIQWSNDDGTVWHHLMDIADITPPRVEFAVNDNVLFWRYEGETDEDYRSLFDLMTLKGADGADGECDCDDDLEFPTANRVNKCGSAVAIVAEIRRIYNRVKEDPSLWIQLQSFAENASNLVDVGSAVAGTISGLLGFGAVASGVTVWGTRIAGVLTFLRNILGLTVPDDEWTQTGEDWLTETLFCLFSRRETTKVTVDLIREWAGHIADIPGTVDSFLIKNIVFALPVEYWNDISLYSLANPVICNSYPCSGRSGDWAYKIGEGFISWHEPTVSAQYKITIGELDDFGLMAIPTPNDTLLYTIRFDFGRKINLHALNFQTSYVQSRDVVSPVISVLGDGLPLTSTTVSGINGPVPTQKLLNWVSSNPLGYDQIKELTISGTIAVVDSDVNAGELLQLDWMRICGQDYAPFGDVLINSDACDEEPLDFCDDTKNLFTDPLITGTACFDFRTGTHGWTITQDIAGRPWGQYVAGQGFRSRFGMSQSVTRRDMVRIKPPNGWAQLAFLRGVIVEYQYSPAPSRNQAGSAVVGARSFNETTLIAGEGRVITQGFVQQIAANAFAAEMQSGVFVPSSFVAGGGYCTIKAIKLGLSGYVPPDNV